ncbi:MAG: zinc-ribbon domain-containing protein [Nitrosarchaeum sp.]|nr:zinc-ribbon domain-containing protein [Nitrosarchaeum sp.]
MSAELRLKKLRGSGGYVMASVNDQQQMKGNLGGPDLFLAPIGRLDSQKITKHFCNTCEKEFEGPPKIEFENPNEEVAENLILAEKGQYICNSCKAVIAEYREFKKQNETVDVGSAKPLEPSSQTVTPKVPEPTQPQTKTESIAQPSTQPSSASAISSIEGLAVYDENAKKMGHAKQVGIDSNQSVVLLIIKNDGTEGSIPWNSIRKVGEVILLGNPATAHQAPQPGKCTKCGFSNKDGSKFCEECGSKLQ